MTHSFPTRSSSDRMVIGHEVGRDMTASRASRGACIGCGAVAPVRGPLAARAIHAFVVAVAVHQLLANEGSGCGEEKFPDHDVLSSDAKGCGHQRTAWGRVPVKRKSSLIPLLWEENSRDFQDHDRAVMSGVRDLSKIGRAHV